MKAIYISNDELHSQSFTKDKEYDLAYSYDISNNIGEYLVISDNGAEWRFVADVVGLYFMTSIEKQVADINGIQTELFTNEELKTIAVEKDIKKNEIFNTILESFKFAKELERIAYLEILLEMGYPDTDMVKLYRRMQNDL